MDSRTIEACVGIKRLCFHRCVQKWNGYFIKNHEILTIFHRPLRFENELIFGFPADSQLKLVRTESAEN